MRFGTWNIKTINGKEMELIQEIKDSKDRTKTWQDIGYARIEQNGRNGLNEVTPTLEKAKGIRRRKRRSNEMLSDCNLAMHARPRRDPWAALCWLRLARAKSEFPTL